MLNFFVPLSSELRQHRDSKLNCVYVFVRFSFCFHTGGIILGNVEIGNLGNFVVFPHHIKPANTDVFPTFVSRFFGGVTQKPGI